MSWDLIKAESVFDMSMWSVIFTKKEQNDYSRRISSWYSNSIVFEFQMQLYFVSMISHSFHFRVASLISIIFTQVS